MVYADIRMDDRAQVAKRHCLVLLFWRIKYCSCRDIAALQIVKQTIVYYLGSHSVREISAMITQSTQKDLISYTPDGQSRQYTYRSLPKEMACYAAQRDRQQHIK